MFVTQTSIEDFVERNFASAGCGCGGGVTPKMRPYVHVLTMPAGNAGDKVSGTMRVNGFDFVHYRVSSDFGAVALRQTISGCLPDTNDYGVFADALSGMPDKYPAILRRDVDLVVDAVLTAARATPWHLYYVGVAVNG